jgi:hypothetical protein
VTRDRGESRSWRGEGRSWRGGGDQGARSAPADRSENRGGRGDRRGRGNN